MHSAFSDDFTATRTTSRRRIFPQQRPSDFYRTSCTRISPYSSVVSLLFSASSSLTLRLLCTLATTYWSPSTV